MFWVLTNCDRLLLKENCFRYEKAITYIFTRLLSQIPFYQSIWAVRWACTSFRGCCSGATGGRLGAPPPEARLDFSKDDTTAPINTTVTTTPITIKMTGRRLPVALPAASSPALSGFAPRRGSSPPMTGASGGTFSVSDGPASASSTLVGWGGATEGDGTGWTSLPCPLSSVNSTGSVGGITTSSGLLRGSSLLLSVVGAAGILSESSKESCLELHMTC